jgi:hypothetical protein
MARRWGVGGNKQGEGANLFLATPSRNVTSQIFETHLISEQYKTHIKKAFHFKLFIKKLLIHVEFKTLIYLFLNVF